MDMLKTFFVAAVFALVNVAVATTGTVSAVSSQTGTGIDGVCSAISQTATSYITEDQFLLSHDEGGALIYRTLDTPIPAGTYDITALSYEPQHPNDPIPGQEKEQWKINLFDADGVVYTSGPTIDIPDDVDSTLTTLGTAVEFTTDITAIQYVHYGWPEDVTDPADYVYNSVIPACVAFNEALTVVAADATCALTGIFDEAEPAKLTLNVTTENVSDAAVLTYQVNWGDATDLDTFAQGEEMMHVYTEDGTYDVVVTVLADGVAVATCDDPNNIVENSGVTVVLGDTDTATGDTAVLAATGISPSTAAILVGAVMILSVPVLATNFSKSDW